MSASTSWNAWRQACLPYTESVLGRSTTSVTRKCQINSSKPIRNIRHVHHVVNTPHKPFNATQSEIAAGSDNEVTSRKNELDASEIEQYPRINAKLRPNAPVSTIIKKYDDIDFDNKVATESAIDIVAGRVTSIRKSGSKLAFIDIVDRITFRNLQIVLSLNSLDSTTQQDLKGRVKLIRRGDIISATGKPYRTEHGERSLRATALPTILTPCLHTIPLPTVSDESVDIEALDRHVEMLRSPTIAETLIARSKLLKAMRDYFDDREFTEVQTPILAASAGGATARPFETVATEFTDRKLALRVAPELWLKRLVVGDMPKVYEIGPSFRNEGLDKTHNPEFTTCEFYAAYHSLRDLQDMTEELLRAISRKLETEGPEIPLRPASSLFESPFAEIDFVPAINSHLSTPLPNLSTPTAYSEIREIFQSHSVPLPSKPTLPRLLDKLCSHYLEPSCINPTWIINIPECLSPLAKSFIHPSAPNNQPVAARAELFINHREIVNCYEEENSPFEQRRKFIDQQKHAQVPQNSESDAKSNVIHDDEAMKLDEEYLRALEYGLPPTGGWGCGIDRLVMLFTGKQRIGDVLSFGNLRAVTRGAEKRERSES